MSPQLADQTRRCRSASRGIMTRGSARRTAGPGPDATSHSGSAGSGTSPSPSLAGPTWILELRMGPSRGPARAPVTSVLDTSFAHPWGFGGRRSRRREVLGVIGRRARVVKLWSMLPECIAAEEAYAAQEGCPLDQSRVDRGANGSVCAGRPRRLCDLPTPRTSQFRPDPSSNVPRSRRDR